MTKVEITTGQEGPGHDPYHVEEVSVTRADGKDRTVTIHIGLGCWVRTEVNGTKIPFTNVPRAIEFFKMLTGLTPLEATTYHYRAQNRCKCGGFKLIMHSGYPGETIYECRRCHSIVKATFDESAVI